MGREKNDVFNIFSFLELLAPENKTNFMNLLDICQKGNEVMVESLLVFHKLKN